MYILQENRSYVSTAYNTEVFGIIIASLLLPLWFYNMFGVNINPADLIFFSVITVVVLKDRILPFIPSKISVLSIISFLTIAGLSLLWTPQPVEALLSFLQYLFIFICVVPVTYYVLQQKRARWLVFLSIWISTNTIGILAGYSFLIGEVSQLYEVTLWYTNQNQVYWLVASAWVLNLALSLEDTKPDWLRVLAFILSIGNFLLVVGGRTITAIIILIVGGWTFAIWIAKKRSTLALKSVVGGTIIALGACIILVIQYWEFIYIQGSLYERIPQYQGALETGIRYFPLGSGLDSMAVVLSGYSSFKFTSVHNFALAYFLELGIIGVVSFSTVITIWIRDVFIVSFQNNMINSFELAFVAVFAGYIIVMLFQPVPVRRFWWVFFAGSWATMNDISHKK
jgi:O-antigen ligase